MLSLSSNVLSNSASERINSTSHSTGRGVNHETQQKAAHIIQQWWKRESPQCMSKMLNQAVFIDSGSAKSFDDITSAISCTKTLSATQQFLGYIHRKTVAFCLETYPLPILKKPTQGFLSAFLFASHPEDTLDFLLEKERELFEGANELIRSYKNLRDLFKGQPCPKTELEKVTLRVALMIFNENFQNYLTKFTERQKDHESRLSTGLIDTYVKMESRKLQITKANASKTQRKIYQSIERSQQNIKSKLGNSALDKLYRKLEELSTERSKEMDSIICDESMKVFYDMALDPKFKFTPILDSPATMEVFKYITEAIQSNPPNYSVIIAELLNIRRKIIQLIPHSGKFIKELREELSAEQMKLIIPQLSNPKVFKDCFLYIADVLHSLESQAHDQETKCWIAEVIQEIANGKNPLVLLPEIFKTLHNKIDEIVVEKKNVVFSLNKSFYQTEAIRLAQRHFQSKIERYEIDLDKTEKWIQMIIERGNQIGLTKEMLCSANSSSHFVVMGLIDHVLSDKVLSRKECPETLLMERRQLNQIQNKLTEIKMVVIGYELYCYAIKELKGQIENPFLFMQKLTDFIHQSPSDYKVISLFVGQMIKEALQAQNLEFPLHEQNAMEQLLAASFTPVHRISKLMQQKMRDILTFYVYRGKFPENTSYYSSFNESKSFKKIAEQLAGLAHFNLVIHEKVYNHKIKEKQYGNLFKLLSQSKTFGPENCPVLLTNDHQNLMNLHQKILRIAHLSTSLTFIRQQIWFSDEAIDAGHLTEEEFSNLFENFNVKKLLHSENDHVQIYHFMVQMFEEVLKGKDIELEDEVMKKTRKMLRNVSQFKNPAFTVFHSEVVELLKNHVLGKSDGTPSTASTLKFFSEEIVELTKSLLKMIEKSRKEVNFIDPPFPVPLPKIHRSAFICRRDK